MGVGDLENDLNVISWDWGIGGSCCFMGGGVTFVWQLFISIDLAIQKTKNTELCGTTNPEIFLLLSLM